MRRLKGGYAVIAVMAAVLAAAPVAGARAPKDSVKGDWLEWPPCVITAADPTAPLEAFPVDCTGSTIWTGDYQGVTVARVHAVLNLLTGDSSGTIDETFTGRTADGHSGTLTFVETFTNVGNPTTLGLLGDIDIAATIVSGSGDFSRASGFVRYVGTLTLTGQGRGTYEGWWRHPAYKAKTRARRR